VKKWSAYWFLALVYASVHLFIAIAVEQLNPFELVFTRTLIAGSLLNGFLLLRGKRYPSDFRLLGLILLLGFLNIALPVTLVAWAQQTVTSGLTSVLNAMTPLFALIFAHFAFADERINSLKLTGILLGFAGVVILTGRSIDPSHILSDDLVAELAIVGSTACFALANVIGRNVIQRGVEPIVLSTGVITSAMVFIGIMAYGIAPSALNLLPLPLSAWLPRTLMAVGVLSLVHTIISYTVSFFVLKEFGVVRTSALAYLAPPISLMLGVVFRGEKVDTLMILGALVILTGVIISNGVALKQAFGRAVNLSPMQSPLVQPLWLTTTARRIRAQFRSMR
jgi:drug/metabolite transporter (DMT)-like permease